MKRKYWIPYVGFWLMPQNEHKWRVNTPDKITSYYVWSAYHIGVIIVGLLLSLYIISIFEK